MAGLDIFNLLVVNNLFRESFYQKIKVVLGLAKLIDRKTQPVRWRVRHRQGLWRESECITIIDLIELQLAELVEVSCGSEKQNNVFVIEHVFG